ncbi:MAG: peptide chain release factor 2 [Desulfotomaculum sp.]|nr:peptide chain release factor 2 [Desulfotomaculum sp.]
MELADLKKEIKALQKRLEDLRGSLDIDGKIKEKEKLEQEMMAPGFWDDQERAQKLNRKLSHLKDQVSAYSQLHRDMEDLAVLVELGEEENDPSIIEEAAGNYKELSSRLENMELEVLLAGKYDRGGAIITLHAGAGGTEAQDWVEMLLRMYTRWAEDKGYQVSILDMLPGDEAGVKSATLEISGPNAFGYLRAEKGVHRLVRISPFDAAGRRHTSFASVDVMPKAEDDDIDIEIRDEDLKIDTFRAGGAGGQHVNKTDSAVRITHLPTGIVVSCQSERSQISNRNTAMKMLKAKLLDLELQKREQELAELRGDQQEIAWGSQIRSYIFHPYKLVKDHRTNVEIGNAEQVMDGYIDPFIQAYLKENARRTQNEKQS